MTVGGPVVLPHYNGHNKAFFFFGYEGWRYSNPTSAEFRIPTAAELSGDFSSNPFGDINPIFNPYTTRPDPNNPGDFIRSPFMCDASGSPITADSNGSQIGEKLAMPEDPFAVDFYRRGKIHDGLR